MGSAVTIASRKRFEIVAVVVLALLAVQLYLFSPWHKHQTQAGQYCKFSPVEKGGALPPAIFAPLIPLLAICCLALAEQSILKGYLWANQICPRAPPV